MITSPNTSSLSLASKTETSTTVNAQFADPYPEYWGKRIYMYNAEWQYIQPDIWGQSGNPILIKQAAVPDMINKINLSNDWTFGTLHEIGHDFTSYKWNFDSEFWANFNSYYVTEKNNATVYTASDRGYYTGTQLKGYYKSGHPSLAYDRTVANGTYSHDGLLYNFIRIREQIGWAPFVQTFQYFNQLLDSEVPTGSLGKLNLFLAKLSDYSGSNVFDMLTSHEKQVYGTCFGGQIVYPGGLRAQRERIVYEEKIAQSGENITIQTIKPIYDFAGNMYTVVECSPTGYYIYHNASGNFAEYSPYSPSPYLGRNQSYCYYGGVAAHYYRQSVDSFVHTVTDIWLPVSGNGAYLQASAEINQQFLDNPDSRVLDFVEGRTNSLSGVEAQPSLMSAVLAQPEHFISDPSFFKNYKYGFGYWESPSIGAPNSTGVCGYVAANLIMQYWNATQGDVIATQHRNYSQATLTQELLRIGTQYFGYGTGTSAWNISDVVNRYSYLYGTNGMATWQMLDGMAIMEIDEGNPVILFGYIPDGSPVFAPHAVVAYGYVEYVPGGLMTFIAHYGWPDYSEVYFSGIIGSVMYFAPTR